MAFDEGNQWWKKRARHGVEAIFTDPAKLWDAAMEYFDATDNRTWNEQDWVGKEGVEVIKNHVTPYTMSGLCIFLGVNTQYFGSFKDSVTFKSNPDFDMVYTRIKEIVETHQVEGAMTGFFNASLTARLNGYADKKDITGIKSDTPTIIVSSGKTGQLIGDLIDDLSKDA